MPTARWAAESLGALLSRVRTSQGKSQLRVAELLCAASGSPTVTRHEVSRWEREQRVPTGGWLRWLAVVLEVPLDELERAAAVTRAMRADGDRAGPSLAVLADRTGVRGDDRALPRGARPAAARRTAARTGPDEHPSAGDRRDLPGLAG